MSASTGDSIVRIPNLPLDKMVDENGRATPSELTFRQTLVSNLQTLFGHCFVLEWKIFRQDFVEQEAA